MGRHWERDYFLHTYLPLNIYRQNFIKYFGFFCRDLRKGFAKFNLISGSRYTVTIISITNLTFGDNY